MKQPFKSLYLIALFLFVCSVCEATDMEFLMRIPKEHQNVFFRTIPFIAVYDQSVLFATDNRDQIVYKIDLMTDDVITIGRPGQGPGDLAHPWLTFVGGKNLYVADDVGISIFDITGKFLNRFRIYNRLISAAPYSDGIYAVETGSNGLIVNYDNNGKKLRSFGERYIATKDIYAGWPPAFIDSAINDGKVLVSSSAVYFVSYYFADLFKYDLKGNLLARYVLSDEEAISKNKKYYLKEGQTRSEGIGFKTLRIIQDACYFDGKISALMGTAGAKQNQYAEIIEFDEAHPETVRRIVLRGTGADVSAANIRNIVVCGIAEWPKVLCASIYDQKAENFVINLYKEAKK